MPTSNQRRNSGRRDSAERGSTSDDAAAAREIQWFPGKPEEYLSFGLQAANQNGLGQRRESSKLNRRAAETALCHGLRNAAAEFEEADARADALSGNCQAVRRLFIQTYWDLPALCDDSS
jgi:hypothetical protein